MSRSLQLALIAVVLAFAPLVILFEDNFINDVSSTISFVVFALAVGYFVYSNRLIRDQSSETAAAGTPGVVGFFAVVVLLCAAAAVFASLKGAHGTSIVLSLVTLALFIGAQFVGSFSTGHLDRMDAVRAQRSGHARWGDRLNSLAALCRDNAGQQALRQLQEKCRYLARDAADSVAENARIDEAIGHLEAAVSGGNAGDIQYHCDTLARLFSAREDALRRGRSKI